ncbi:hypothetical protein [Rhizobium laguerreae]|uniref:hypothetical protein n=1 Tax=Rhizobium laguerreae TaxID=1076926 RepID=UPI001C900191|nr:hypothetical protein [Rhizobium laguerreae]MBY3137317.1 hypothetical protein [Rhizobium laguerreae]
MISRDLAAALDPALFMAEAGYPPDPWQATFLRSTSPRTLLLSSRQLGKSTVTGALASHAAIYLPGSLILLLTIATAIARAIPQGVCVPPRGY